MEQQDIEAGIGREEKKHTLLQYLVVVLLAGVLLTLIGGYIYLGMERAKEQPQADVTIEESADQAVELTTEERLQILDSLSTDSGEGEVSFTPEDRQAVLESLETSSGVESEGEASVEMSPEDRRALLDSLQ